MGRKLAALAALLFVVIHPALSLAQAALPPAPSGVYVYDGADALSDAAQREIEDIGARLEAACGAQITVALIPSLEGEDLEGYALRLFREWGIGQAEENNGVLLLLAMEDRQARIEVGYGLEGALPDGKCGRILDDTLIPALRDADVDAGVLACYSALVQEAATEYNVDLSALPELPSDTYESDSLIEQVVGFELSGVGILVIVGIGVVLILLDVILNHGRVLRFLITMAILSGRRGGRGGRGGGGGGGGFGGGSSGGGGASRGW